MTETGMKAFFQEILEYSHYCNQRLAAAFSEQQGSASKKAIMLFSHLLNAHHIWNNRVVGTVSLYGVWDLQPVHKMKWMDDDNFRGTLFILENYSLDRTIYYQNSQGHGFNNKVRDILFHIINHSTYHRAQIAADFRENAIEPIITDYIFYKR